MPSAAHAAADACQAKRGFCSVIVRANGAGPAAPRGPASRASPAGHTARLITMASRARPMVAPGCIAPDHAADDYRRRGLRRAYVLSGVNGRRARCALPVIPIGTGQPGSTDRAGCRTRRHRHLLRPVASIASPRVCPITARRRLTGPSGVRRPGSTRQPCRTRGTIVRAGIAAVV